MASARVLRLLLVPAALSLLVAFVTGAFYPRASAQTSQDASTYAQQPDFDHEEDGEPEDGDGRDGRQGSDGRDRARGRIREATPEPDVVRKSRTNVRKPAPVVALSPSLAPAPTSAPSVSVQVPAPPIPIGDPAFGADPPASSPAVEETAPVVEFHEAPAVIAEEPPPQADVRVAAALTAPPRGAPALEVRGVETAVDSGESAVAEVAHPERIAADAPAHAITRGAAIETSPLSPAAVGLASIAASALICLGLLFAARRFQMR